MDVDTHIVLDILDIHPDVPHIPVIEDTLLIAPGDDITNGLLFKR